MSAENPPVRPPDIHAHRILILNKFYTNLRNILITEPKNPSETIASKALTGQKYDVWPVKPDDLKETIGGSGKAVADTQAIEADANLSEAEKILYQAISAEKFFSNNRVDKLLIALTAPAFASKSNEFYQSGNFSKPQAIIGAIINQIDAKFTAKDLKSVFPKNTDNISYIQSRISGLKQLKGKNMDDVIQVATHKEMQNDVFSLPYPSGGELPAVVKSTSTDFAFTKVDTMRLIESYSLPAKVVILQPRIQYQGNAMVFIQNGGEAVRFMYGKPLATIGSQSQAQIGDIAFPADDYSHCEA